MQLIWNTYYTTGEVPHATRSKGSFWWKDVLKLCEAYRGVATCKIRDGSIVIFWTDVWNDQLLCQKFPRLFSYAKNKTILVA
jgi:hypothetical protein